MKQILLLILIIMNSPCVLSAAEEIPGSKGVKVGTNKTHFWSRQLDPTKPYELTLTVIPIGGKFVAGSAKAQSSGNETWVVTVNTEAKAVFRGTVKSGSAEKQYTPSFSGKFKPGSGTGPGTGSSDLTWTLKGAYTVGAHIYENSFVDKAGRPDVGDQVDSKYDPNKTVQIDVPLKNANNRANFTRDLAAATPDGSGNFTSTKAGLTKADRKRSVVESGLKDPEHGDMFMKRQTVFEYIYTYAEPSSMQLPVWKQANEADVNADALAIWNAFVAALTVHEEGHRGIFITFLTKLDGVVNAYNKQSYVGEACYGSRRTAAASNRALELARLERTRAYTEFEAAVEALNADYKKEDDAYEKLTDHGRTQSKHDPKAKNTIIPGGEPLTLK